MKVGTPTPHKDRTGKTICVGDTIAAFYGSGDVGIVTRWTKKSVMYRHIWEQLWNSSQQFQAEMEEHFHPDKYQSRCPPEDAFIIRDLSGTMPVVIAQQVINNQ